MVRKEWHAIEVRESGSGEVYKGLVEEKMMDGNFTNLERFFWGAYKL